MGRTQLLSSPRKFVECWANPGSHPGSHTVPRQSSGRWCRGCCSHQPVAERIRYRSSSGRLPTLLAQLRPSTSFSATREDDIPTPVFTTSRFRTGDPSQSFLTASKFSAVRSSLKSPRFDSCIAPTLNSNSSRVGKSSISSRQLRTWSQKVQGLFE